jgi:hypothetical protein
MSGTKLRSQSQDRPSRRLENSSMERPTVSRQRAPPRTEGGRGQSRRPRQGGKKRRRATRPPRRRPGPMTVRREDSMVRKSRCGSNQLAASVRRPLSWRVCSEAWRSWPPPPWQRVCSEAWMSWPPSTTTAASTCVRNLTSGPLHAGRSGLPSTQPARRPLATPIVAASWFGVRSATELLQLLPAGHQVLQCRQAGGLVGQGRSRGRSRPASGWGGEDCPSPSADGALVLFHAEKLGTRLPCACWRCRSRSLINRSQASLACGVSWSPDH